MSFVLLLKQKIIWSNGNYIKCCLRTFEALSVLALCVHCMVRASYCWQNTFITVKWKNCRVCAGRSFPLTDIGWKPSEACIDAWIWLSCQNVVTLSKRNWEGVDFLSGAVLTHFNSKIYYWCLFNQQLYYFFTYKDSSVSQFCFQLTVLVYNMYILIPNFHIDGLYP